MSSEEEAMNIIFKMCGGAIDLLKQLLSIAGSLVQEGAQAVKNKGLDENGVKKTGLLHPLNSAKAFIKKNIPFIGDDGQIDQKRLATGGDEIVPVKINDDDLKKVKSQLKKLGVAFSINNYKNEEGTYVMVKAKDAALLQIACERVALDNGFLTQEQIDELKEPDINSEVLSENPEMLKNPSEEIKKENIDWKLTNQSEEKLEYSAEYGKYDIKADTQGNWQVSKMGQEVSSGQSQIGVKEAMLQARIAADVDNKPEKVKNLISPIEVEDGVPKKAREERPTASQLILKAEKKNKEKKSLNQNQTQGVENMQEETMKKKPKQMRGK